MKGKLSGNVHNVFNSGLWSSFIFCQLPEDLNEVLETMCEQCSSLLGVFPDFFSPLRKYQQLGPGTRSRSQGACPLHRSTEPASPHAGHWVA